MLVDVKGYDDKVIAISSDGSVGEVIELHGLLVGLPKKPRKADILFHDLPKSKQCWRRF